ncbi:MAG TPA: hypothetical protein PKM25_16820, partial [Candidatus Ozemobacteraceae bacterium]|nr:hypothetical protein [Candidatus Ozemobacteraceae bacterium]
MTGPARFRKDPTGFFLLSSTFLLILLISAVSACDPEPGPHHFPPPVAPEPVFKSGYFEVHNSLNGLPCNRIRSVLTAGDTVLAGTEGGGLMILKEGGWRTFSPETRPAFPSWTATSLSRGEEADSVLAATPNGLIRISGLSSEIRFEPVTAPDPTGTNILSAILYSRQIWAGTDGTAGFVSGNRLVPCRIEGDRQPTGFGAVTAYEESAWFGTSLGLYSA